MIADSFCADELRWRPVELKTVADVDALNALFAEGWRIEPIDLEGLPFLAFCGREGEAPSLVPRARQRGDAARLLLILQRSAPGARTQRALFVERGLTGYIELAGRRSKRGRMVGVFPIGRDATVTIYEDRAAKE